MKRVTISLGDELFERIRKEAFEARVSVSERVRGILEKSGSRVESKLASENLGSPKKVKKPKLVSDNWGGGYSKDRQLGK